MKITVGPLCLFVLFDFFTRIFARSSYYYDFSAVDRARDMGYPIETHPNVQTEDGYLIDLFRIPNGKTTKGNGTKPVALFMHGLYAQSDSWLILGENTGLPFILAEQNYDVWLGNVRGTYHGRKHVSLNPDKDPQFWDFSFHEIGLYDLPAIVNHIRNVTGNKAISYIGHSQGSSVFYVLTSKKPEYNAYFNVIINLAPGVYILTPSSLSPPEISRLFTTLDILRHTIRLYETGFQIKEAFCKNGTHTKKECYDTYLKLSKFIGEDTSLVDKDVFERGIAVLFDSASSRQGLHLLQVASKAEFSEYDFGIENNLVKYADKFPPRYNLKNCNVPAAIFYGKRDIFVTPTNANRLIKSLPNVIFSKMYDFTHMGFVGNNNLADNLYKDILQVLKQIN